MTPQAESESLTFHPFTQFSKLGLSFYFYYLIIIIFLFI